MNSQNIVSFQRLGDLYFNMNRDDVHSLMGENFESFSRTGNEILEIDFYKEIGLLLNFDNNNKLELIEAVPPSNPHFKGITFLERNPDDVYHEIIKLGYKGVKDDVGCDFPDLGFGIFVNDGRIQAVSVYRKGYYDP